MALSIIPTRRKFMQGACAASLLSAVPLNEASARERVEHCYQQLVAAMTDLTREHGGYAWYFTCSGIEDGASAPKQQTQKFTLWCDENVVVNGKTYHEPKEIAEYRRYSLTDGELGSASLKLT